MAFQLSAGVLVVEKDLTSIIPAVASSTGAFAGAFAWGPVMDPTQITSENQLVSRFAKPQDGNAAAFFTAANFLAYSNNMMIVRAETAGQKNSVVTASGALASATVVSPGLGFTDIPAVSISGGTGSGGTASATLKVAAVAVASGGGGTGWAVNDTFTVNIGSGAEATFRVSAINAGAVTGIAIVSAGSYTDIVEDVSLPVDAVVITSSTGAGLSVDLSLGLAAVTVSGGNYTVAPTLSANGSFGGSASTITVTLSQEGVVINNEDQYLSLFVNGGNGVGEWAAKYPGELGNSLKVSMADADTFEGWDYADQFDSAPSTSFYADAAAGVNDELHIIVIDEDGAWTGVRGAVLEKFAFVSKASDARRQDGSNNYYRDVINTTSKYVWWMDHTSAGTNWGTPAANKTFAALVSPITVSLVGGSDDLAADDGDLQAAYALFRNDELYDISLIATGQVTPAVAKYVVDNVAEYRRDCIAFVSPTTAIGAMIQGDDAVADTVSFRTGVEFNVNSSYAVMDSGFKYMYDRYNDVYRWVPLNGDIAGVCARTDYTNDAWWSPGGLNRGQIKNVIKLSLNPNKSERDELYKNGINPVVSFPGQGTVLYGDKTLLAKPSAFDRINIRRLFIVLEKAIATAAKFQLFEFNDSFTRAQFRSLVEPFLRDVQGRRGIIDFRVKCDENNNTGEVIDRNEFIADIFIKPNRAINFITLNFIAARSSVSFDEIGA